MDKREKQIVTAAVDSLIETHNTTGIDLTLWPELQPLVQLVYPELKIRSQIKRVGKHSE